MSTTFLPPSCFDVASGINGFPGTPTPPETVMINYAGGIVPGPNGFIPIFEEYSDSPDIESGEQSTIVHKYHCDYYTGQLMVLNNPRGSVFQDSKGFVTRVLSTRLTPIAKTGRQECNLTITSEAMGTNIPGVPGFQNPPDEFNVDVVELNPALYKHPRYNAMTYIDRYNADRTIIVDDPDTLQQYKTALSSSATSQNDLTQSLEYANKRYKGEDSFYLAGYKLTFTQYFWLPQSLNPGGYIEDPTTNGSVPYQFWSTTGNNDGSSIFSLTGVYNQNMYIVPPPFLQNFALSWLRQADTLRLQRTWWSRTQSWIGGPIGHWDAELYSQTVQPYQTNPQQGYVL